ncbi:hypothetical protein EVAR_55027_1 [Eumeta japonica]|uniref:Uncharacterized protein n=1 Tax=Eumeta variegata TaxID=151549 RepID=A0A4C1ZU89_EUMVA|nr:hypothetical protein EVAR_55027_1 [Eumeta japonica]
MSQRRGGAVGPLIGRAVRDARRRQRARRTALLYASAARHSQSAFNRRRGNTLPSSETKFWSALRPPSKTRLRVQYSGRKYDRRLGLVSFGGPASPSTVRRRTVNPDAPAALIPMSGG